MFLSVGYSSKFTRTWCRLYPSSKIQHKNICQVRVGTRVISVPNYHMVLRTMCILFTYVGDEDADSDYSLIIASNRDEIYDRPAQKMAAWSEDLNVIGGRDLEAGCDGGTWLALSPQRRKIGVLLNLPGHKNPDAKTRGKIVADYIKSETSTTDYIECIRDYSKECNEFVFVTVEVGSDANTKIQTYSNKTDKLTTWTESYLGFSNSLPETPLRKVENGIKQLQEILSKFKKVDAKNQLKSALIDFLRSKERHYPDPRLLYPVEIAEHLSSIFVKVPERRYGTRTHTLILVSKTGQLDVIEIDMQPPFDPTSPKWETTELRFKL